jgi:hypothetical protein
VALLAVSALESIKDALLYLLERIKPHLHPLALRTTGNMTGLLLVGLVGIAFGLRLDPFNPQPAKPISDTSDIKLADIQWTHYFTTKDLAEGMLAQMEDGSLIFSDWRMLYPMQYVAIIQGAKPNVTIIEMNPYPGNPLLTATEIELIEGSYPTRAIYFTRIVPQLQKDYRFVRSDLEPYIYRLEKK